MAQIQSISPNTSADEAMAILDRDGAVIDERLLNSKTMEVIQAGRQACPASPTGLDQARRPSASRTVMRKKL